MTMPSRGFIYPRLTQVASLRSKSEQRYNMEGFPMGRRILTAATLVLIFAIITAGQSRTAVAGGQSQAGEDQTVPSPRQGAGANVFHSGNAEYRIGCGDVLQIRVEKAPELSGNFHVAADGSFPMPYVGQLQARGKTTEELTRQIADGLRGKYLKNPQVSVEVLQYNSHTFFVQGAVRSPGTYQVDGAPTLLQMISIAGGLSENHGATAFIMRLVNPEGAIDQNAKTPASTGSATPITDPENAGLNTEAAPTPKYEVIKVSITRLFTGNLEQNLAIQPGDIVNIPKTDVFFVAGEVRQPGSFPQTEGTTLRQAISMSQGTTIKAATGRAVIFRENPKTGKHEEIPVDVGAIMKGKRDDIQILANDVIYVPNSKLKSLGNVLLTGFGTTAFYSVPKVP
jgi:polysaccharide biosynthesis/export protein